MRPKKRLGHAQGKWVRLGEIERTKKEYENMNLAGNWEIVKGRPENQLIKCTNVRMP